MKVLVLKPFQQKVAVAIKNAVAKQKIIKVKCHSGLTPLNVTNIPISKLATENTAMILLSIESLLSPPP